MTTGIIITNLLRGQTKTSISQKQRDWLIRQAREENLPVTETAVYFQDRFYTFPKCRQTGTASYIAGLIQGQTFATRYQLQLFYLIQFEQDPCKTTIATKEEMEEYNRNNKAFRIINPAIQK